MPRAARNPERSGRSHWARSGLKSQGISPCDMVVCLLNAEVKAELDVLPVDIRASFERIVSLVQVVGLERVHEPYIKRRVRPDPPRRARLASSDPESPIDRAIREEGERLPRAFPWL